MMHSIGCSLAGGWCCCRCLCTCSAIVSSWLCSSKPTFACSGYHTSATRFMQDSRGEQNTVYEFRGRFSTTCLPRACRSQQEAQSQGPSYRLCTCIAMASWFSNSRSPRRLRSFASAASAACSPVPAEPLPVSGVSDWAAASSAAALACCALVWRFLLGALPGVSSPANMSMLSCQTVCNTDGLYWNVTVSSAVTC